MPTLIGIAFLAASIICLTVRKDYLFPLLVFSGIFQAASVVSFESFGIPPYYLVACCFILDTFVLTSPRPQATSRVPFALTAFCVVGALSAFVGPLIFAGIPVYDPSLGIDAGFLNGPEPL